MLKLGKNAKRKHERYDHVPMAYRVFSQNIREIKQKIYRKPYHRLFDHYETPYRRPIKTEIIEA